MAGGPLDCQFYWCCGVAGLFGWRTVGTLYADHDAWVLIRFRDGALEGVISFRRAFAFEVYVVFYAALLFAVIQYVYFQFVDGGRFFGVMQDSLSMIAPLYEQQGVSVKELTQAFNLIAGMPVIELVFAFMMQTIFVGWVLGLVVALIFRRSVPPVRRV